jgi:hypothetical protein
LAGCSSNKEINVGILAALDCREIAMQWNLWKMVRQNCSWERLNFGKKGAVPAKVAPSAFGGANAAANAADH